MHLEPGFLRNWLCIKPPSVWLVKALERPRLNLTIPSTFLLSLSPHMIELLESQFGTSTGKACWKTRTGEAGKALE